MSFQKKIGNKSQSGLFFPQQLRDFLDYSPWHIENGSTEISLNAAQEAVLRNLKHDKIGNHINTAEAQKGHTSSFFFKKQDKNANKKIYLAFYHNQR